jgi:hypothetical protein
MLALGQQNVMCPGGKTGAIALDYGKRGDRPRRGRMREGGIMAVYMGKILLIVGGLMMLAGLVFLLAEKIPLLGQLPGDIRYQSDGGTIYVPITTCLLLSIVLTVVLNLLVRLFGK